MVWRRRRPYSPSRPQRSRLLTAEWDEMITEEKEKERVGARSRD